RGRVAGRNRPRRARAGRRPGDTETKGRGRSLDTATGSNPVSGDVRRFAAGAQRHDAATAALGVAVAARVPVLLWGAPGTGKTSTIRAMAEAMGWPCETVIASIREPSDFAGLPVVVLEQVVGDLELPADVSVVAAANPPEQAADGWDLSAPLANRLCHLAWEIDPRAVADGLAGGWAAPVVPTLPQRWEAGLGLTRGLVAAFLHVRPALACAPPADAASAGRGWPSPRTWDLAGRRPAAGDGGGGG